MYLYSNADFVSDSNNIEFANEIPFVGDILQPLPVFQTPYKNVLSASLNNIFPSFRYSFSTAAEIQAENDLAGTTA